MTLDPVSYVCAEHNADLTVLVTDALDDDVPPVAFLSIFKRQTGPRPFRVIVTCPGQAGTGSHQLTCEGNWNQ